MPRYFFVLPDVQIPSGGVNVALRCAEVLNSANYEAYALFSRHDYTYPFYNTKNQISYFHPPLIRVSQRLWSRRRKLLAFLHSKLKHPAKGHNRRFHIRPDDVFVIPEFAYPEYAAQFPNNTCILLAQDVISFSRAYARDRIDGTDSLESFEEILTTSKASQAAIAEFSGKICDIIPQVADRPTLKPTISKKRQIAYMPRKRLDEVEIIVGHLANLPELAGWSLVEIKNLNSEKRDEILSESLIFLAFSHREGFGLPPAEAMAAGAIVIGFTGVGGDEYFTSEYGYPIQDSDIVRFVATVRAVVMEYEVNSLKLDEMRQRASQHIKKTYNIQKHKTELLRIWSKLDAQFSRL